MTLGECVRRVDTLRPNAVAEEEKARWLLGMEEELRTAFFPRYMGQPQIGARQWPEDKAAVLTATGAFEEFYLYRLLARLELADQEWEAYNVYTTLANRLENEFKKDWARTHARAE